MAAIHHATTANYALDFSGHVAGVLDLSRSRQQPTNFFRDNLAATLHGYGLERRSPLRQDTQRLSPAGPDRCPSPRYEDKKYHSAEESFSANFNRDGASPSLYSAESKELLPSPRARSGEGSPVYAPCYPGAEHLSPYIIQAAFRQQLLIQNKLSPPPKSESDAASDAGSEGSQHSGFPIYPMVAPGRDGKVPRPFKAYPKDPMSLAAGFTATDSLLDMQSAEKYSVFRKRMLEQICAANGGQATVSNPKMRRTVNTGGSVTSNTNCYASDDGSKCGHPSKDNSYSERRKKNNAAAKKSRDRRRIKEDEIAIRAAFLERENIELKFELAAARKQLALCGISAAPSS